MWKYARRRKIQVKFLNGETSEINPFLLNTQIETGKVIAFRRSGGWVQVGRDPIRGSNGHYQGVERRQH